MGFEQFSQAGQDVFAHDLLAGEDLNHVGSFLDIGSGHPIELNNSYALELLGWRGMCVDKRKDFYDLRVERESKWVMGDALDIDFEKQLRASGISSSLIDYLSIDCDSDSLGVIERILDTRLRFRVITIEHDSYAQGDVPKTKMRSLISEAKYLLVCSDVCAYHNSKFPFEDWWVDPFCVDMSKVIKWLSHNDHWEKVLKRRFN